MYIYEKKTGHFEKTRAGYSEYSGIRTFWFKDL